MKFELLRPQFSWIECFIYNTLTVKSRARILPSDPHSLTADLSPSKKLLRLEVSILWIGTSATWRASLHRVERWDPTAPINSMLPLQGEKGFNFNLLKELSVICKLGIVTYLCIIIYFFYCFLLKFEYVLSQDISSPLAFKFKLFILTVLSKSLFKSKLFHLLTVKIFLWLWVHKSKVNVLKTTCITFTL